MAKSIWTFNCPNKVAPIAAQKLKELGFEVIENTIAKTPQFLRNSQNLPKKSDWIKWYEEVMSEKEINNEDPHYFDHPFQCLITEEGDFTDEWDLFLSSDQEKMEAVYNA